jgi:unsaturated rhamnogalacturonyl hydrolase
MTYKYYVFFLLALTLTCVNANAQKVTLDYYFNHEVHKTSSGTRERFHYTWEDKANTGFSIFGDAFRRVGAQLDTLDKAPTITNLKGAAIYIIVDPDTKKESPNPNYIELKDVNEIAAWVKSGGILVMMANDSANVELPHFNHLAAKFGMHFNDDLQNHVIDDHHFADGAIITAGNPIFKTAHKIFMKDVCSIGVSYPARAALKNSNGAVIMATAKFGKGTVFAVGDPWLYNEYTNGRLPVGFENDKAANDIAEWLLKQVPKK